MSATPAHRLATAVLAAGLLAAGAMPATAQIASEGPLVVRAPAEGRRMMVSSAHPLATRAGLDMLARGGSAVDAAIAVQLVLGLVEPQSSGIGGGAFVLHYDARDNQVSAYDGRETAPGDVDPNLFIDASGQPMRFREALVGGRSVGVPGLFRVLEMAHARHGRLPWPRLFAPAIRLAEQGFPVSPQLSKFLSRDPALANDTEARALYFTAAGTPKAAGTTVRNPAYARTLRAVAKHGADWFYAGHNALAMVARVRGHDRNPGLMTLADLASYQAKPRMPLCFAYRRYELCSMPPPSSGGIAVAQILGMLEATSFATAPAMSEEAIHLLAESSKRAFADRNRYVADSDFVSVPAGLTDAAYLAARAKTIGERSSGLAGAGTPAGAHARTDDPANELHSTSHLSVIDSRGNAVAMTTTIETVFGAHIMTGGYLLNNQLTDFSFAPSEGGRPVANRVEPGKRPRSSMSPVLVFERGPDGRRGELRLVAGSPGGSMIIGFVAKVLVGTLDWQLSLAEVLALPNFGSRNVPPSGALEIERGRFPQPLAAALAQRGHAIADIPVDSGVHAIERRCAPSSAGQRQHCRLIGAADPRREGAALGR